MILHESDTIFKNKDLALENLLNPMKKVQLLKRIC